VFKFRSLSKDNPLSIQDRIFGVGAAFSALYCVAVSFMLSQPEARKRFLIALAIFTLCFSFVKQKKGAALGIAAFIVIRIVWGIAVTIAQGGKLW